MKNYFSGKEARDKLMTGVFAVRDAVAPTLGAKGKDALLERMEQPYSEATNDGETIAQRVRMDDYIENMGANLIKEAISRANRQSGDGSTTTCVLTAAILEEGQKYADSTEDIKQSLFDCIPLIHKSIDEQTKPITLDEVSKVATISAQSEEMGTMLQEIFQKIGKDGVIDWDNSFSHETFYEIKEGVELKNTGFTAQWMANENAKGPVMNPYEADRATLKNPKILITQEKISGADQLEPYLKALSAEGKRELVVFFDEIELTVMQALAATWLQGKFKVILLKAPTLWKDWIYEDFALMTGATIIGTNGATWKNPTLNNLGTCEKLVAFKSHTNVIGTKDISEHIAKLKEASKKYPDFAARAEWLNSKSAVVKLGGRSEVEISHKKAKLEDASNSCKLALNGGIVAGGGVALKNAATSLPDTVGGKILAQALLAPIRQIAENAHITPFSDELDTPTKGLNVKTGQVEDMLEVGIWDAALIEKNAISSAISVAGTVLSCDVVIPLDRNV